MWYGRSPLAAKGHALLIARPLCLVMLVLIGLLGGPGCQSRPVPVATLAADRPSVVPTLYDHGRFYVFASINGEEPVKFLFDTGASINLIEHEAAVRLGLRASGAVSVTDSNEVTQPLRQTRVRTLDIGPATLRNVAFVIAPATEDSPDIAGIIGLDGLGAFTVDIDYPERRLRILAERLDPNHPGVVPMRLRKGPTIDVPLRFQSPTNPRLSAPVWALLDTGGQTFLRLDAEASRMHTLAAAARPVDFNAGLHRSSRVVFGAPINGRLILGHTSLPGIPATVNEAQNLLGYRVLEGFRVRIDGPSRLVAFTPPESAPELVALARPEPARRTPESTAAASSVAQPIPAPH